MDASRFLSAEKQTPARGRQAKMAAVLEQEILQAKWRRGAKLPSEEELCLRFRISRSAVREALQVLKSRGLVESRRGSGSYVVREMGAGGIRDMLALYSALQRDAPSFLELLDLRLLVETFCVRQLISQEADLRHLRNCLNRMEAAVRDFARFGREDIAFHLALAEGTSHRLFSHIMRGLLPDLGVKFALETYTNASLVQRNLEDHRAIFRLLERSDAIAAERRLRKHLLDSRRHLEALLRTCNQNPPPLQPTPPFGEGRYGEGHFQYPLERIYEISK